MKTRADIGPHRRLAVATAKSPGKNNARKSIQFKQIIRCETRTFVMVVNPILEARMAALRRTLNDLADAVDDNLRSVLRDLTCDDAASRVPLKSIEVQAKASRDACLILMAKERPVAGDLRFAMAALRIVHDYERIQELADALQKRIEILRGSRFKEICREMTGVMADILSLHDIVRTYWKQPGDSDVSLQTAQQDKLAADIQLAILNIQNHIAASINGDKSDPEPVIEVVLACRHLKRIASMLIGLPEEMHSFG